MRKISSPRKLMYNCAIVNYFYMDYSAAGRLPEFNTMASLYRRIASESLVCAQSLYEQKSCPAHEPATDAFWWAVVSWAINIGDEWELDRFEWHEKFVSPHIMFAQYLRPSSPRRMKKSGAKWASDIIILNDIIWTKLVIRLTAEWGLFQHFKDVRALFQARRLMKELRLQGKVRHAYLESDIWFLRQLFAPFEFGDKMESRINIWLSEATEQCLQLARSLE